ncbi:hypothetical protein WA026_015014, partial [Henosepilachna vigintioctopunctata]
NGSSFHTIILPPISQLYAKHPINIGSQFQTEKGKEIQLKTSAHEHRASSIRINNETQKDSCLKRGKKEEQNKGCERNTLLPWPPRTLGTIVAPPSGCWPDSLSQSIKIISAHYAVYDIHSEREIETSGKGSVEERKHAGGATRAGADTIWRMHPPSKSLHSSIVH